MALLSLEPNETSHKIFHSLPEPSWKLVGWLVVLSLFLHLLPYGYLAQMTDFFDIKKKTREPIKIKIVSNKSSTSSVKMLETPQTKTKPPQTATRMGTEDHIAEKEMKLSRRDIQKSKGQDAGRQGVKKSKVFKKENSLKKKKKSKSTVLKPVKTKVIKNNAGRVAMSKTEPRNNYEKLLSHSYDSLSGMVSAGYQDYVDEEVEIGDRIDINTKKYRYIGYFSGMRKSIELVWNYPAEAARRGLEGKVGLEFTILKNGNVRGIKVIKSSGFEILDKAIKEAIKLAAPFSPLPKNLNKESLVVTGTYSYIIGGYASSN